MPFFFTKIIRMTSPFLYSGDETLDKLNILSFIDAFAKAAPEKLRLGINLEKLDAVIATINNEDTFPCENGLPNASIFKKVAYFVCCFAALKPITTKLPLNVVDEEMYSISNHQNGLIAFLIAEHCLYQAKIISKLKTGASEEKTLKNQLYYSRHSLNDIVDVISEANPKHHFKTLTIFFEQFAYKTNSDCQYPINSLDLPECP